MHQAAAGIPGATSTSNTTTCCSLLALNVEAVMFQLCSEHHLPLRFLCGMLLVFQFSSLARIPPYCWLLRSAVRNHTRSVLTAGAVAFEVLGIPLIYLIMAASCALFAALCLETYGLRVREVNATVFEEKMNLRGR